MAQYKHSEEKRKYWRQHAAKRRLTQSKKMQAQHKVCVRNSIQRNKEYVKGLKDGKPCTSCGIKFPHWALDYDHVFGEKRDNIAHLVVRGYSIKTIEEEISKCELVCANCHVYRTWQRKQTSGKPKKRKYQMMVDYKKQRCCTDCNKQYHHTILQFDHVIGKKEASVSSLVHSGASEERIWDEVAKCKLRCAVCHRRVTLERRGFITKGV